MFGCFLAMAGLAEQAAVHRDYGIAPDDPIARSNPADGDRLRLCQAFGNGLQAVLTFFLRSFVDVGPNNLELHPRIFEPLAANGASGTENESGHEQPCGKEGATS